MSKTAERETLRIEVDGEEAVIDGTIPREERMVEPDVETLVIELAKRTDILERARSERGRASNAVKMALERRDELVDVLAARGIRLRSPDLPFDVRSDAERAGGDDEMEDDAE
jgi:hypothetical protein